MGFEEKQTEQEAIDEELAVLDQGIKRLRIDHDQYFLGILKRPPTVLLAKVQKIIIQFSSAPPRNTRQKFRYNQLNSRFQVMRQQWGRIQRQIDAGTYKPHRFKADLREKVAIENADGNPSGGASADSSSAPGGVTAPGAASSGMDRLYNALQSARRKTGEHGGLDATALAKVVRQQTTALKKRYGDAKIRFKVVIEDDRAKIKATVSKT
ncbi:MAG: hypothetical protein GY725_23485 [bacterium]|nr:hypothetical protein [bacterium]